MKKCDLCKKIMTSDEELATRSRVDYTYALDWDFNYICDSCDAKRHAQSCIRAISADMQQFRKTARKDSIYQPVLFLEKKLKGIREYWIKHFTELVDLASHEYWKKVFGNYVEGKTNYLINIEEKDKGKKEKINY